MKSQGWGTADPRKGKASLVRPRSGGDSSGDPKVEPQDGKDTRALLVQISPQSV